MTQEQLDEIKHLVEVIEQAKAGVIQAAIVYNRAHDKLNLYLHELLIKTKAKEKTE